MNILENKIIPAKQISSFKIGDSFQNLLSCISGVYKTKELNSYLVVNYSYYKFWISKENNTIVQIGVYKGFGGTFMGIGIGSTLLDIKNKFGNWCESLDIYLIPHYKGFCFELSEDDTKEEWIPELAQIESMYVYNPLIINANIEFIYDIQNNKYIDKVLIKK